VPSSLRIHQPPGSVARTATLRRESTREAIRGSVATSSSGKVEINSDAPLWSSMTAWSSGTTSAGLGSRARAT
jgi:hypothetical protein